MPADAMSMSLSGTFISECARHGLDLAAAFQVGVFNCTVDGEERLPDLGRPDALGVLVGNSARLWAPFRRAVQADPGRLHADDPLDAYVMEIIARAAEQTGVRHIICWGHTLTPRALPIQRIAACAGMAALSPSHLSVHPEYGPWIALRAVVVFDAPGPEAAAPPRQAPCLGCRGTPCLPALEMALRFPLPACGEEALGEPAGWRQWLAVRDACPVGTSHRYGSDQIAYHYTKRKSALAER